MSWIRLMTDSWIERFQVYSTWQKGSDRCTGKRNNYSFMGAL